MAFTNRIAVAVAAGLLACCSVSAQQNSDIKQVVDSAEQINKSAKAGQQKVNKISDQIDDKVQQFKALNKEIDGLDVYNAQLRKQISNQMKEMADLNESIDKVSVIERQITPLMLRMIDGLEQFIALDMPFLPQERSERIANLKKLMDRSDVAPSEKFRRVMEAYSVELDYGRTIEAYTGIQNINGQDRDVDFLRIGRTVLVYQTRDGSMMGAYNKKTSKWEDLPSSYRSQITAGLRMAKKQAAPNLIMLPVEMTD